MVGYRRHGVLPGARRGKAMPARGLPQECCQWRHSPLQGARRGQAVQGGGLHQVSCWRHGLLRGAWRRQALPARGLPQGCCKWRHSPLRGAWRRQALSAPGLHHGCCKWRHAALQGTWRRQALSEGGLLPASRSWECELQAMSTACAAGRCGGGGAASVRRGPSRSCGRRLVLHRGVGGAGRGGDAGAVGLSDCASIALNTGIAIPPCRLQPSHEGAPQPGPVRK